MEGEERAIWFNDLAEFVDHKARVATNPLFGKIVEDSRPRPDTRQGLLKKGFHEKTKERHLVLLRMLTIVRPHLLSANRLVKTRLQKKKSHAFIAKIIMP